MSVPGLLLGSVLCALRRASSCLLLKFTGLRRHVRCQTPLALPIKQECPRTEVSGGRWDDKIGLSDNSFASLLPCVAQSLLLARPIPSSDCWDSTKAKNPKLYFSSTI
jgi:hypothetical protein